MAGPLKYLINSIPPIGELPHQPNIETAETSPVGEVQNWHEAPQLPRNLRMITLSK